MMDNIVVWGRQEILLQQKKSRFPSQGNQYFQICHFQLLRYLRCVKIICHKLPIFIFMNFVECHIQGKRYSLSYWGSPLLSPHLGPRNPESQVHSPSSQAPPFRHGLGLHSLPLSWVTSALREVTLAIRSWIFAFLISRMEHSFFSVRGPSQGFPPLSAHCWRVATSLKRCWYWGSSVWHTSGHWVHLSQGPNSQSTAGT